MKKVMATVAMMAFTTPLFATIDEYIPATSPLVLRDGTAVADLIQFTPSPADALWHVYKENPGDVFEIANQEQETVGAFAEGLVGVELDFLFGVETLSEHANRTFGGVEFNVLAYHYAGKELIFYYENAISDFTLGDITKASDFDLDQELSNIRVYANSGVTNDATSPGHVALLGFGLVALGLARKLK